MHTTSNTTVLRHCLLQEVCWNIRRFAVLSWSSMLWRDLLFKMCDSKQIWTETTHRLTSMYFYKMKIILCLKAARINRWCVPRKRLVQVQLLNISSTNRICVISLLLQPNSLKACQDSITKKKTNLFIIAIIREKKKAKIHL